MITYFFLNVVSILFGIIMYPFPTVEELPWGVDSFMVSGLGGYKAIAEFFPPFNTALACVLIYIGFRLGMLVLKVILGSRVPSHD